MTDAIPPQTPKKLFKPSAKIKTPTRSKASSRSAQQPDFVKNTLNDSPHSGVSKPDDQVNPESLMGEKPFYAQQTANEASDDLKENHTNNQSKDIANTASSPTLVEEIPPDPPNSPLKIDECQKVQASHEIKGSPFTSPESSSDSSDDTLRASKSLDTGDKSPEELQSQREFDQEADEGEGNSESTTGSSEEMSGVEKSTQNTSQPAKPTLGQIDPQAESQHRATPKPSKPADVSKVAEGTFRDADHGTSKTSPTNKMGEPDVSTISDAAHPSISGEHVAGQKLSPQSRSSNDHGDDTHAFDNMGRPAHVERSIEIPLQRDSPEVERHRGQSFSTDLGDFEELPSTNDLPSLDDLPEVPKNDFQDPPEEVLDPSVHAPSSPGITPIPKIPKIPHAGSAPSLDPKQLAQGLAGLKIDDVGSIVDESGKVLGHATGDLPAMVGKKVSKNGEVYGDDGSVIGYVSENFINGQPSTGDSSDVLSGLKVDHEGNILDSDGNVVGKLHDKPGQKGSSKHTPGSSSADAAAGVTTEEEQNSKVNAHTGGSPSDIFMDVKSTTDGIQLTIRIPTTFARPVTESQCQ